MPCQLTDISHAEQGQSKILWDQHPELEDSVIVEILSVGQ